MSFLTAVTVAYQNTISDRRKYYWMLFSHIKNRTEMSLLEIECFDSCHQNKNFYFWQMSQLHIKTLYFTKANVIFSYWKQNRNVIFKNWMFWHLPSNVIYDSCHKNIKILFLTKPNVTECYFLTLKAER